MHLALQPIRQKASRLMYAEVSVRDGTTARCVSRCGLERSDTSYTYILRLNGRGYFKPPLVLELWIQEILERQSVSGSEDREWTSRDVRDESLISGVEYQGFTKPRHLPHTTGATMDQRNATDYPYLHLS